MNFIDRYDTRNPPYIMTAGKVVEDIIDDAPDYYDGEIESIRSKLYKTTRILGLIVDLLTDEQQMAIISNEGYKHEPVKGETT